jgi:hypothetical protein
MGGDIMQIMHQGNVKRLKMDVGTAISSGNARHNVRRYC